MVYNNIIIVYNNMQYYNNIKTQPDTQRQRPSKWSWWLALGQAKGKRQGFCLGLPVGGGAEAIWPSSTVFPGTPVVNWIRGRTARSWTGTPVWDVGIANCSFNVLRNNTSSLKLWNVTNINNFHSPRKQSI